MELPQHCPKPLLAYMERHGLSQAAFGKRIGASQAAVSLWINNKGRMSIGRAAHIQKKTKGEIKGTDLFPRLFGAMR